MASAIIHAAGVQWVDVGGQSDIIRAEGARCGVADFVWGIGIGAIVPRRRAGVFGGGAESIPG